MVAIWLRSPHSARNVRVKASMRMGETSRRSALTNTLRAHSRHSRDGGRSGAIL